MIFSEGESHERGVAIILGKEKRNCIHGYWYISDRVILVKLNGCPFSISMIMVYAQKNLMNFRKILKIQKQCKPQGSLILMGDLNAKVGKDDGTSENSVIGKHVLGKNDIGDRWVQW